MKSLAEDYLVKHSVMDPNTYTESKTPTVLHEIDD